MKEVHFYSVVPPSYRNTESMIGAPSWSYTSSHSNLMGVDTAFTSYFNFHFWSRNYKFVLFKWFGVRKNSNHKGHQVHSYLFLGELIIRPRSIEDINQYTMEFLIIIFFTMTALDCWWFWSFSQIAAGFIEWNIQNTSNNYLYTYTWL